MKKLQKLLPKNTFFVFANNKNRTELTKCELDVLNDLIIIIQHLILCHKMD